MEVGASNATLVSENQENVKPPLHRHSKLSYMVAIGAMALAVGFMVATALIVDEKARSQKIHQAVEKELKETQAHIEHLQSQNVNVCMTKECITSASQLLESIDDTVDPCDDFFEYACGGWKRKNPVPNQHGHISEFSKLNSRVNHFVSRTLKENSTATDSKTLNKTRTFYAACNNMRSIEKVGLTPWIELLNSYGEWPLLVANWSENDFDWRKASASATSTFNQGFLFEVANFIDANDTDRNVIYIDQAEVGVPTFVLQGPYAEELRIAYTIFIYRVIKEFRNAIYAGESTSDNATASEEPAQQPELDIFSFFMEVDEGTLKDIDDLISFQADLANITTPDDMRSWEMERMYNSMSVAQLQAWISQIETSSPLSRINWYEYLNDIYSGSDVFISRREHLVVLEPDYLHRLVELLDRTNPRVIGRQLVFTCQASAINHIYVANFFFWKLILNNIDHGPLTLLAASDEFWSNIYNSGQNDREAWCIEKTEELFGTVVGSVFVKKMFSAQAKKEVELMVETITEAFTSLVKEASWMDETTKENAVLKAAAMKVLVAHPDWMNNDTYIDQLYEQIMPRIDSHFQNYIKAKSMATKSELASLRVKTDRSQSWYTLPNVVNAFYLTWINVANIPAGILHSPFYTHGGLAALNYGGIGSIIGHEITHGFDDYGHKRDKDGREISWWTNSTLEKYRQRTKCMEEQYGNYSFPELVGTDGFLLNGKLTLGENIADNGGLREAYQAYQNHVSLHGHEPNLPGLERFTSEQLFFLAFANVECSQSTSQELKSQVLWDSHSPSRYRIIGPLSNFPEFSENFHCPLGSRMNRVEKCVVW